MASLSEQREIQLIKDMLERLRKADAGAVTGTFTPIFGGSSTDGTFTYSVQFGRYKLMYGICQFRLTLVAATRPVAATGNAQIGPLPFTSIDISNSHTPVVIDTINDINLLATTVQLSARIPPNTAAIEFVENPDSAAVSLLPAGSWAATTAIRISGWYEIA